MDNGPNGMTFSIKWIHLHLHNSISRWSHIQMNITNVSSPAAPFRNGTKGSHQKEMTVAVAMRSQWKRKQNHSCRSAAPKVNNSIRITIWISHFWFLAAIEKMMERKTEPLKNRRPRNNNIPEERFGAQYEYWFFSWYPQRTHSSSRYRTVHKTRNTNNFGWTAQPWCENGIYL